MKYLGKALINTKLILVIVLLISIMVRLNHIPNPYKNAVVPTYSADHKGIRIIPANRNLLDNYTPYQPF